MDEMETILSDLSNRATYFSGSRSHEGVLSQIDQIPTQLICKMTENRFYNGRKAIQWRFRLVQFELIETEQYLTPRALSFVGCFALKHVMF